MSLTFAQLIQPLSFQQLQQRVINALQGLGVIVPSNGGSGTAAGTGSVSLSGTPGVIASVANNPYLCVIKVTASGEPGGTAQVQTSIDGGSTWLTVSVPSNGQVAVSGPQGATGVTATLSAGPLGAGTSFVSGDQYAFPLFTPNFPTTAWQSGSVPRVLAATDAIVTSDWTQMIAAIAAGGIAAINPLTGRPYASGPWADLLGQNVYGLTRNAAVAAVVNVVLTDAASQGPFTITTGQLIVSSNGGQLYQNTAGGTLTKGGTLTLAFQALVPGSAGSAADNTITTLNTPLPGVTVNNPGPGSLTTSGTDQETDLAYMQRCTARWPTLAAIPSATAVYDLWARTADATITRTRVLTDGTTAGQVDVYVAGSSGPVAGSAVTNAQNYINARVLLGTTGLVINATGDNVTVSGTVNYFSSKTTGAAAQAAVAAALNTLFTSFSISDGTGVLYLNSIVAAIEDAMGTNGTSSAGIRNVVLSGPVGDTALALGHVPVLINSLTFTGV